MEAGIQERYWNQMTQYKFQIIYYNEYFAKCVHVNRTIIILIAVLSSGAVAGWTIWNKYNYVWAMIVAFTQVLTVVNEFLPYKERIKEFPELINKLNNLYNSMESRWLRISSGKVNNADINTELYEFKEKWDNIDGKYLCFDSLPESNKISIKANQLKQAYYKNQFEGEINDECQQQSKQTSNT